MGANRYDRARRALRVLAGRAPRLRSLLWLAIVAVLLAVLGTCSPPLGRLAQIQTTGTVTMATVNSATTYYLGGNGPTGFEYDLGQAFARKLGAKLRVLVVANRQQALQAVTDGRADFAAGLAISPQRKQLVRFAQPYYTVTREAVYRNRGGKPTSIADLSGHLTVPAFETTAQLLRQKHPDVDFVADTSANAEELLYKVAKGKIRYTIADSNLVKINQRYFPALLTAFTLGQPDHLAWAFARQRSDALYNKAIAFFNDMLGTSRMKTLKDRYFGHLQRLGFVGGKAFARQVEQRLPRYRAAFKKAGKQTGVDWRLLAAIGYQESHWRADAVSPTKVRGLMMLTMKAAEELGVRNRRDPAQSIAGGARYYAAIYKRLEGMGGKLQDPDKIWMALAAYNIGMGHLMDARRLVQRAGGNPDSWIAVRAALAKLTQERYFKHTRYGYARGHEAVGYVGNIRAYYDILLWMTSNKKMAIPKALTEKQGSPPSPPERALDIDIPAL